MKRSLEIITSPLVLASLALPPVLWFGFVVLWMKLSPYAAAGAMAFQVYYAALCAALAVRAALSARSRSYGNALLTFGAVLVLLQGAYAYGSRFTGRVGVGEGEAPRDYQSIEAGPWAKAADIPFRLLHAAAGTGACTVELNGLEQDLIKGQSLRWKDWNLAITGISEAPLFILSSASGLKLEAGYIKLPLDRTERNYFQFRVLPHRFYIALPGKEREQWKVEGNGWKRTVTQHQEDGKVTDSGVLHLMITRGKIVLIDRDVQQGETVRFEGHSVRFEQGAPWVELSVEKVLNRYLLYCGLCLLFAGGITMLLKRREP